ncbi:MAG: pyruvate dehydrogenase complex dihydrolipoamide acetyltransferase [Alphaproteobacteria bacterium]|nr:pyruvate dehydrogenase complex dihydrolipoamide acetyltransferase [Alphaproteobacteria bacterium]|tara:strand:- start:41234 stop:42523 length:1290 start_codon:yes stop_codon:yes gene_type:complete
MPIKVTMPALSPTMTDGTLANWLKAEGDTVEAGDVIAEIETDKATMEVEAVDEGILGKILIEAGTQNVPVNDVIAVLLEDGEDASAIDGFLANDNGAPAAAPAAEASAPAADDKPAASSAPTAPASNDGKRIFVSPLARRIAADKGIDLSTLTGTGPRGRIVKADVENAKPGAAPSAAASAPASKLAASGPDAKQLADMLGMEYEAIPNNNIKKVTAQRLTESKQTIPHFYLSVDCQLDNLLAARKKLNDQADGAYKLSVNDFIIKASAMALKSYPAANVAWTDDALLQFKHADISIAVATPTGLITPIVKAAEEKGLAEISNEMKDLAGRAREGKLKPHEFQGGTFSISNLGMFGVNNFQAIVNPPQSCILAVGAGNQVPVVENGEVKIRTVMNVTLSTDHRSVDGAVGAEFLQHFKRYIENPVSMLV